MSSINSATLVGRLTQDPEATTKNDKTVCRMRIAVQRPKRNGEDGGANYFDVVAFDAQAVNCGKYLRKGRQIAITGRLNHNEYKAADGSSRQRVEIIANTVMFLDGAKRDEADQEEPVAAAVGAGEEIAF